MHSANLPLRMRERKVLLALVDVLAVSIASWGALMVWAIRDGRFAPSQFLVDRLLWSVLLVIVWLLLAFLLDLYDLEVAAGLWSTGSALAKVTAILLVGYLLVYFAATPQSPLPRGVVLYYAVFSLVLVGGWRWAYRFALAQPAFRRQVVVVGAGTAGTVMAEVIQAHRGGGLELLGFIDDDLAKQDQTIVGLPVLGTCQDLEDLVRKEGVHQIVLAITHDVHDTLFRALVAAQEQGVEITPMPVLFEDLTGKVPIEHVGDNWLAALPLDHAALSGFFPLLKRGFDVAVSAVGLAIFGILFPGIALALYIDSPGPIFYRQERVGRGGSTFRVFKLRSMVPDAEKQGRAVWAEEGDPRITRVGRILRATHLDEFPQFVNILKGEMSVVGPRPERPAFVAELEQQVPFHRLRHAVKPGMAGWALVNHGYSSSVEDAMIKVQYDLYYIKHQSLYLDMLILFKTLLDMVTLGGR